MKKRLIILVFLLPLIALAIDMAQIKSPGSGGMVSNVDVQEVPQDASYFSKNVDVFTTPGLIQRRRGLKTTGANADTVYGAAGYLEPIKGHKLIVGITRFDSTKLYTYRTRTFTPGSPGSWAWGSLKSITVASTNLNMVSASDTFGLVVSAFDTTVRALGSHRKSYIPTNTYYDFLAYNGTLLITSKQSQLYTFTSRTLFTSEPDTGQLHSSDVVFNDTIGYKRRALGAGLLAPGQLRVVPIDSNYGTGLTGVYQWAYSFGFDDTLVFDTLFGKIGLASNIITLKDQYVYLTGFLHRPYLVTDSVTDAYDAIDAELNRGRDPATQIKIVRRNVFGDNKWKFVDLIWAHPDSAFAYIDSGQSGVLGIDSIGTNTTIPPPGSVINTAFALGNAPFYTILFDAGWTADHNSTYWIRYSFYDPVLDIESPLGPAWQSQIMDSIFAVSSRGVFGVAAFGLTRSHTSPDVRDVPSDWVRLYRNLTDEGLLGGGDTLIWYCMGQYRIDRKIRNAITTTDSDRVASVFLGIYSDSQLASGTNPTEAQFLSAQYSSDNIASDDDGAIVRPPFKFGLQVRFSDIEYANGRLWGIGDDLFPQRLYYSKFDDMGDWSPIEFLSLSEDDNDELVAIESVPSQRGAEVLYAFKHNSIFAITGFDAEFDLQFTTITRRTGALDRFSVIKYQDEIFWLAPDMKIYSSTDFQPISDPIENYVDSLFTNYITAQGKVRAFALTDKVCWINISSREAIAYHTKTRTWSRERYSGYIPYGTFQYDTLVNSRGFGENSWLAFRVDSAQSFMVEREVRLDTLGGDSTALFVWNYQTPFIGDGIAIWMIPYVEFTATADDSTYLWVSVWNGDGDSLVYDSIIIADTVKTTYRLGLPRHSGEYLSVRFRDGGGIKLSSVNIARRRLGRARIK